MALAEDYLSRRQYGLRFRNLETGNWYPEMLDNVSPDFVWGNDSETVYYVKKHVSTLLPYQVWRHTVGTDSADDELVYEEKDETFYVSLHKTSSRHYVIIFLSSATTSEVLLLDAELPDAQPLCFLPRRKDHEYSLDHFQHSFYLRSNREGKNFGLYKTKVRDERKWEVLIPARDQVMLEGFTLFTDWLVVEERQRGLTSIRQINRKTREVVGIAFDDPAYVTWIGFNPEPESSRLRYGYSSMTDFIAYLRQFTGPDILGEAMVIVGRFYIFDPALDEVTERDAVPPVVQTLQRFFNYKQAMWGNNYYFLCRVPDGEVAKALADMEFEIKEQLRDYQELHRGFQFEMVDTYVYHPGDDVEQFIKRIEEERE